METLEITFNEKTIAGKNLLAFLEQNKKYVKVKDPTKMTKKEFYAMIDEAIIEAEQGKVTRVKSEDFKKFLGLE